MPTQYDGDTRNVGTNSSMTITGATNANPIQITVSGSLPADMQNGCLVDITGVVGNTAANGVWPATVTGANTFTIPVAGNAAYVSGGNAQPLNLTPLLSDPSDGDPGNAASVPGFMTAADRTQFSAGYGIGKYKLVDSFTLGLTSGQSGAVPPTPWGVVSTTTNAYAPMNPSGGGTVSWNIPFLSLNDLVEFEVTSSVLITTTAGSAFAAPVGLAVGYGPYGGSSGLVTIQGAQYFWTPGSSAQTLVPMSLRARFVPTGNPFRDGSTNGQAFVTLYCNMQGAASANLEVVGDYVIAYRQWRHTGMPQ